MMVVLFNVRLLDNNLPLILPGLSIYLPHSPRSYADPSDFHLKKVKNLHDNDLTYVGYGSLRVENSLPE